MTAAEVKRLLGLAPHPREGGWYIRTYESAESLPAAACADGRYSTTRRIGTAIYYFLDPGTFSEMHLLQSDEIFHFYAGDPVEMLQLHPGGAAKRVIIGNDLVAGHRPQVVVGRRRLARFAPRWKRSMGASRMHRHTRLRNRGLHRR